MSARGWQRTRQTIQVLALLFFIILFIGSGSNRLTPLCVPPRLCASALSSPVELFFRLDPLVALTATLAGRALVSGFALAGLTLLLTLLFGRVWCGWLCPLGTLLEWIGPLRRSGQARRHVHRRPPPEKWRAIKYLLLVAILMAALLGNQTLLFADPMAILTRTMATAIWPAFRYAVTQAEAFLYQFRPLWGALDALHRAIIQPLFQELEPSFILAVPMALFLVGLVALNWWAERFWCRYLCPLGGLLGLLSKLSLVRREVSDTCARCARCVHQCPTDTIDPGDNYRSDPAECIVCFDCLVNCTREGADKIRPIGFRWLSGAPRQLPRWRPARWHAYDPTRRQLLAAMGASVAGVVLAGVEPIVRQEPVTMVRPPGATLTDFSALCIRCGACMRVCPTQGLQPSFFEGGVQHIMTPRLEPRLGYCSFSCNACGQVCPTGAIPNLTLEEKQHTPIGLARIDRDRCLPWAYNIPCIVCEEACPVAHKAIWLEEAEVENAQGERIVLQRPRVVKELCIGCGICEYQCPMGGESAIRVYAPTEVGAYLGYESELGRHSGNG